MSNTMMYEHNWYNDVGIGLFLLSVVGLLAIVVILTLKTLGVISVPHTYITVAGLSMTLLWTLGISLGGA